MAFPLFVSPPIFSGSVPAVVTWSEINKASEVILSNNDLTASDSGSSFTAKNGRSDTAISKNTYFEVTVHPSVGANFTGVGIFSSTQSYGPSQYPGRSSSSVGLMSNGEVRINQTAVYTFSPAPVNNDIICVAYNPTTNKAWFRINNGNWDGSVTDDPATGTGGFDISANAVPPMYMGYGLLFDGNNPDSVDGNFGPTFAFTPPSGFSAP